MAQRVVTVRPPAGSLRRGWLAAPPGVTATLVALAVLGLLSVAAYPRIRPRARTPRR